MQPSLLESTTSGFPMSEGSKAPLTGTEEVVRSTRARRLPDVVDVVLFSMDYLAIWVICIPNTKNAMRPKYIAAMIMRWAGVTSK